MLIVGNITVLMKSAILLDELLGYHLFQFSFSADILTFKMSFHYHFGSFEIHFPFFTCYFV